jgi:potassium-dependent mechanosensitive channel
MNYRMGFVPSIFGLLLYGMLSAALGCLPVLNAWAQEDAALSTELVEKRLAALRDGGSADDSDVVKTYEEVRGLLAEAASQDREAAKYVEAMTTSPKREAEIQARIDALDDTQDPDLGLDRLGRADIEARLVVVRAELAEANVALDVLKRRLAARETNADNSRTRLVEIGPLLEAIPDVDLKIDQSASPSQSEAERWFLAAQELGLIAERRALEARLTSQPVRYSAMAVEWAEQRLNIDRLLRQVKQLETRLGREVKATLDAQSLGIMADDPAYGLADRWVTADTELRESSIELNNRLAEVRRQIGDVERRSQALRENSTNARRVVDFAAESDVLGSVLLAYWSEVDNFKPADPTVDLSRETAEAVISRIKLEESLKQISSATTAVNRALAEEGIDPLTVSESTAAALVELVLAYRKRLRTTIDTQSDLIEAVSKLGGSYRALSQSVREYEAFLKSMIIWIPAFSPLWEIVGGSIGKELDGVAVLIRSMRFSPQPMLAVGVMVFLLLFHRRQKLIDIQQSFNKRILRPRDDAIEHTLLAIGCVALRALPWPILLIGLGKCLSPEALGSTIALVGFGLFGLLFARMCCEADGIGRVHFRWNKAIVSRLYTELGRIIYWWLPLATVTGLLVQSTLDVGEAVIARSAALGLILILLGLVALGIARGIQAASGLSGWNLLNTVLLLLIAVLSMTAVAILLGHMYSVTVLFSGVRDTLWIGGLLLLLHALLMRWVTVTRRRLRLQELMGALREHESSEDGLMEEQEANLIDVSVETTQLINMAFVALSAVTLFYIWSPLLPAFDVFSKIILWTSSSVVDGEPVSNEISLAMLIIVFVLAGLTLYAARKLPALIDLILRSRTSVSASARYTVSTLLNYVIVGGGIVAGLSALGLQWSQLQWLVAALGVGIGFGLQEIIANFISGLIILFERPIRIGDVVSTGDKDGVVTRIRIRATTIRDWDGKELLVPNKEFITGRLLNWSLSDPKVRLILPVGIAYGSDVELALKSLMDTVTAHPRVVEDPEPQIVFESFGDNALLLSARCHLDSLENRMGVITQLNKEIYRRFEELGIVIAFPQRDVHFDAEKPIRISLDQAPSQTQP